MPALIPIRAKFKTMITSAGSTSASSACSTASSAGRSSQQPSCQTQVLLLSAQAAASNGWQCSVPVRLHAILQPAAGGAALPREPAASQERTEQRCKVGREEAGAEEAGAEKQRGSA
eukprot:COSAG04_NODE_360_length_15920_cov_50.432815_6_plen_117_part_00